MTTDNPMRPEETRIRDLLSKRGGYTDEEIEELRSLAVEVGDLNSAGWQATATFRTAIETIAAIKRFDRASGDMVRRGNCINTWVLVFAIIATLLGGAAVWVSLLSYQVALSQVGK